MKTSKIPKSVDSYIAEFPDDIQKKLKQLRVFVKKTVPKSVESISYMMPAYKLNGKPLAYFAGYKNHIGFYPIPSGIEQFKGPLSKYKIGKGSVQFPLDEALPFPLIKKIVMFRAREILSK